MNRPYKHCAATELNSAINDCRIAILALENIRATTVCGVEKQLQNREDKEAEIASGFSDDAMDAIDKIQKIMESFGAEMRYRQRQPRKPSSSSSVQPYGRPQLPGWTPIKNMYNNMDF